MFLNTEKCFSFVTDEIVLEELKPWREQVQEFSRVVLGTTRKVFTGSRAHESSLGNFITDSYVYYVSIPKLTHGITGWQVNN